MMNQGDIFKKVGQILNELQDQYEFLAKNPEQLNELELELFLANSNFLTDHVGIVRKLNFNKSVKELPQHTETAKEVEQIQLPVSEPELESEPVFITPEPQPEAPQPEPEKQELSSPFEFIPEEKEVDETYTDLKAETTPQPNTNNQNQRPTLNDLLAGKGNSQSNLNTESNKTSITDLKKAITLNEKLLYIKDLFNGYNLAYSEAIDLINKMPDFETADAFLRNNYAAKNNWEAKQSTADQFYELLNQRFSRD